ncbi:hypothetical protein ON010_g11198 [Phytophthora cinnamomi]|nr:hypothetical protein ON010_g11198 [Phytophthora cinnamomi]
MATLQAGQASRSCRCRCSVALARTTRTRRPMPLLSSAARRGGQEAVRVQHRRAGARAQVPGQPDCHQAAGAHGRLLRAVRAGADQVQLQIRERQHRDDHGDPAWALPRMRGRAVRVHGAHHEGGGQAALRRARQGLPADSVPGAQALHAVRPRHTGAAQDPHLRRQDGLGEGRQEEDPSHAAQEGGGGQGVTGGPAPPGFAAYCGNEDEERQGDRVRRGCTTAQAGNEEGGRRSERGRRARGVWPHGAQGEDERRRRYEGERLRVCVCGCCRSVAGPSARGEAMASVAEQRRDSRMKLQGAQGDHQQVGSEDSVLVRERASTLQNGHIPDVQSFFKANLRMDMSEKDIDARVLKYFVDFDQLVEDHGFETLLGVGSVSATGYRDRMKQRCKLLIAGLAPAMLKVEIERLVLLQHKDAKADDVALRDLILERATAQQHYHLMQMEEKPDKRQTVTVNKKNPELKAKPRTSGEPAAKQTEKNPAP